MADYTFKELVKAFKDTGVKFGDVVFIHSDIGLLGLPEGITDREGVCRFIHDSLFEVLGDEGTLVVPTFTYSLTKGEIFNPDETQSTVGIFTEWFRKQPGVVRTLDPIFSVAIKGKRKTELSSKLSNDCFSQDAIFGRLYNQNALILSLGISTHYWTFLHYAEQTIGVKYRFKKKFVGKVIVADKEEKVSYLYYVKMLDPRAQLDISRFEEVSYQNNILKKIPLGRGFILSARTHKIVDICKESIGKNMWFLTKSSLCDNDNKANSN